MSYRSDLGNRIRQCREDAKLTQKFVADALNLDTTSVNKYEKGNACPKMETVARLADVFRVSKAWLAFGEETTSDYVLCDDSFPLDRLPITRFEHLTPEEQLLTVWFRQLNEDQRRELQEIVQRFLNEL